MTDEDDIGTLLRLATKDEPPPTSGATEVFHRAGSIQRRRRITTGLAGIATLGLLTAGGLAIANQFGSSGDTPIATVPAASGPVAPTPSSSSPGVGSISPAAALSTLRSLLPAGSEISGPTSAEGFARLVLADGPGRSAVEVNIQPAYLVRAGKAGGTDVYDCAVRAVPKGAHCASTTLADQTRVVTIDGPAGEPGAPAVTMRQVDVLTPADVRVVVSVWNAVDVQHGPVTRPAPGLTMKQLQAMATSGQWAKAEAGTGGAHN
jgi:hypothetical protein